MNVKECMLTRRSIRKYKADLIPDEVLEEIMEVTLAAPSAINLQPWYFVVIRTPEALEEFRGVMREVTAKNHQELVDRFPNHPQVIKDTESFMVTLGGAPACVLVFALKDYPERDYTVESTSAAIENLMLGAWDHGLGTCWMAAPARTGFGPALRDRFAPGKGELIGAISIGYPDQAPKMPARKEGRFVFI